MELRPEQKAAALIIGVGSELGGQLLDYLDEEEVERLAAEVARLERVDSQILDRVVSEVKTEAAESAASAVGGLDYVRRLLSGWKSGKGSEILADLESDGRVPFRFMREFPPNTIARVLEGEHPQLVALVVASQSPSFAAQIMGAIDEEVRAEVALRVARMRIPSSWAIEQAEEVLRTRLSAPSASAGGTQNRGAGVRGLAKVLNNAEPSLEHAVLEALGRHDPALAEQVRSLMFVFEDLVTLDDRAVQRVLGEADTTTLAVALKGASEDVSRVIMRNMSQRARERLEEEIDLLGPVPKKDVDAAREKISAAVLRLGDAGEIMLKRGGDAELVA